MNQENIKSFLMFGFFLIFGVNVTMVQHQIMSYQEYAKIDHDVPYVYRLTKGNQVLFYFGANHSCDPNNEQYPLLEKLWDEFLQLTKGQDAVVLIEGTLRNVQITKQEAITKGGGEGGLVTFLAHQAGIRRFCPEPDEQELNTELQKAFSADEISYRMFAQRCLQFNRYKAVDSDLDFERFYQGYSTRFDFSELSHMKSIHDKLFETPFDPNDEQFFYNTTNPVDDKTIINKVCRQASILRDQCIVDHIQQLIAQGKNIFIVYGSSHAVMQEQAIRAISTPL